MNVGTRYKLIALLLTATILSTAKAAMPINDKSYTSKDANIAIDAFHKTFYNPEMKLYAISSDMKGRAAIWVQAVYWDMMMNTYKRTKLPEYRKLVETIYQGGYEQYDKYNWNNNIEWFIYDDMMWWIISLGRAYQLTGEPKYLAHASAGFYHVWKESYDTERGGMWWNFKHDAKMSCINYPTVVGAMTLFEITKDSDYLQKAENIYGWSQKVFFNHTTGCIADNMHYHFQRPDGMDIDWTAQLYNQGTFIGAATMLYKATKNKSYLNDAILAANYVRYTMCDKNGLLPFKNGIEQGIYTAIFAQYIVRLIEDAHQPQYKNWLRNNINIAWNNRDTQRDITFKNASVACPKGVMESYDASACPALMQVVFP